MVHWSVHLLPSAGGPKPLAAGDPGSDGSEECEAGDDPVNNKGRLENNLATNVVALQLNIWLNEVFNGKDLGAFTLTGNCLEIPQEVLDLLNDPAREYSSTIQDLLDLANDFLAGLYGDDNSLAGAITEAGTTINEAWDECRSPEFNEKPDCDDDDEDEVCEEAPDPNEPFGDEEYESYWVEFEDGWIVSGTTVNKKATVMLRNGETIILHTSCSETFLGPDNEEGTEDDGYGRKEGPDPGQLRVVKFMFWKYDDDYEFKECCGGEFEFAPPVECPEDCSDDDPCTRDECDPFTGECIHTPIFGCDGTIECTDDNDPNPSPGDDEYRSYWVEFEDGTVVTGVVEEDKKVKVEVNGQKIELHISCSEEFLGPDRERGTADDDYGEKEGPYARKGHPRVTLYSFWRYDEDNEYKECCAGAPEIPEALPGRVEDDPELAPTAVRKINLYPNPSHEEIYLDLGAYEGMPARFTILNAMGEVVQRERTDEITRQPIRIRMELPGGLYYIRMNIGGVVIHKPFVLVEN